ncbi:N-acetylglucosamine repressor [Limihaloglobus sulfuriphilus]|uniref:N-acetylglucosamine repressor n=1 Tax=Limihaloglobus sulfuriphilus TaxID=1851148 RepID=A0A1Q2MHT0_9BACT|nr:ROK family transcriptional regulator [Limihaloglobus sulfuriphilus]AQQ72265.1 N-acetylglucosamine repressor [Limihaloglobus sulfuriphilus]
MTNVPLDLKAIGIRNEHLVLCMLSRYGRMSQTQLRRRTKLSVSTLSYIISRLRSKQLINESKGSSSSRGPKPMIISINPRGAFILGVDISPNSLRIGLFDFEVELVESKLIRLDNNEPEHVCSQIASCAFGLLSGNSIDPQSVLGIGVGLSGTIKSDGSVELSSPMGWKSVPVKEMLQSRFCFPVSMFTTRTRLLAETESSGAGDKNVMYVNVGSGVGSHIISDGRLLRGATDNAGEIGHIVIDPDGPECGCGNFGCLETFISGPAIARRIRHDIENGVNTSLSERCDDNMLPESIIAELALAVKSRDRYSIRLQSDIAEQLASAVAVAINFYDPQKIILGGYVALQCFDAMKEAIFSAIKTEVYDSTARQITIVPAKAGEDALVIGCARAVLEEKMAF